MGAPLRFERQLDCLTKSLACDRVIARGDVFRGMTSIAAGEFRTPSFIVRDCKPAQDFYFRYSSMDTQMLLMQNLMLRFTYKTWTILISKETAHPWFGSCRAMAGSVGTATRTACE